MGTALQFALAAMQLAAAAAEHSDWGVTKVQHFVDTGTDPSEADWNELNARTEALRARLNREPT